MALPNDPPPAAPGPFDPEATILRPLREAPGRGDAPLSAEVVARRRAYLQQHIAQVTACILQTMNAPAIQMNEPVRCELITLCEKLKLAASALASGRDAIGQPVTEKSVARQLHQTVDHMSRYGLWLRLDMNYGPEMRHQLHDVRDRLVRLVACLQRPEDMPELTEDELAAAPDAPLPPAPPPPPPRPEPPPAPATTPAPATMPAPTMPASELPPTVRVARAPLPPLPPTPNPALEETASGPLASMRSYGRTTDSRGELSTMRQRSMAAPPPVAEQTSTELKRPRRRWPRGLLIAGMVVAALATVAAGAWLADRLLAPAPETESALVGDSPAGLPSPNNSSRTEPPPKAQAKEPVRPPLEPLPPAFTKAASQLERTRILIPHLIAALGHPVAGQEREKLLDELVAAYLRFDQMPVPPAQPAIPIGVATERAKAQAEQALKEYPPFQVQAAQEAAAARYPYHEIGDRVSVTYQPNPQRHETVNGEFQGVEGGYLVINRRRFLMKDLVLNQQEALRFNRTASTAARTRMVQRQRDEHAAKYQQALTAKTQELLPQHRAAVIAENLAAGYLQASSDLFRTLREELDARLPRATPAM